MEYRIIPTQGREQYRIYEDGTVVRESRVCKNGHVVKELIIKPYLNEHGYVRVSLYSDKKVKHYFVHRLVANAFCEKSPEDVVVNHLDGNKLNNHYTNLEWTTISGNLRHAYATGLKTAHPLYGEEHWACKFTYDQIKAIRSEYVKGSSEHGQHALARKYNVSQALIWYIVNNKTWGKMPT